MMIIMPLWLWLLILPIRLAWRITAWSLRLAYASCRWTIQKSGA
jgi:hypothetical protein